MAANTISVVQILLNRHMGYPDLAKNDRFNKTGLITRQLLNSRSPSKHHSPVRTVKVKLSEIGKNCEEILSGRQSWMQIEIPNTAEVLVADTRILTRKALRRNTGDWMVKEEFFSVEPFSGFKCVKSLFPHATGIVETSLLLEPNLEMARAAILLLTRVKDNVLSGYNMVENKLVGEIPLSPNISGEHSPKIMSYTDMHLCNICDKIFLVGTVKNLAKTIIVLDYPPWEEMKVIHICFSARITISNGLCFVRQGKRVDITTCPLLLEQIGKGWIHTATLEPQNNALLPVKRFEANLRHVPESIAKFEINPSSQDIGVIKVSGRPLMYVKENTRLKLFTFQHNKMKEIFEYHDAIGDLSQLIPLSGDSIGRVLCLAGAESQLVEFKTVWGDNNKTETVSVTSVPWRNMFDHWEKVRPGSSIVVSAPARQGSRRSQRESVRNSSFSHIFNKTAVLSLTYCATMDLIAVLTADDEEFQVAIYEPLKLDFVKALPAVHAWPSWDGNDNYDSVRRGRGVNQHFVREIDDVEMEPYRYDVDLHFQPDFICVSFRYPTEYRPYKAYQEMFFTRLLAEPEQQSFQ